MQHSLLLAEDDADLRELVVRGLREEDFAIEAVGSGSELLRAYDARGADLLILDVGLPDADGRDVCATLRARGDAVPVVFLTARDGVPERVAGYEAGGDDYVTKPFALGELAERIRALLRRSARRPALAAGGLRIDTLAHAAVSGDASAPLTPIEFRILSTLLQRPGEVVRRRALATAAWPAGAVVLDNTLDACVSRLRRKLTTIGVSSTIDSVHGVGYRIRA
jgi:two-component system, OmpR family, response regulator